jgi:two-component system chemotaxis response regulator CheB
MLMSGRAARDGWPVVALVASAGGIEAISHVLSGLPAELPACVLVLVHLSPERETFLPEVFARVGPLGVEAACDGDALAAGRVLVAPPGEHTLVTSDLCVALIKSGAYPPHRPSADLLLTTLAIAAGPRAIAVVLSGHGHDGATGATAIHRFGGTVLATDQASSRSFSMPSATIERDHAIDQIVDLAEMPGLLTALVTAPKLDVRRGPTLPTK